MANTFTQLNIHAVFAVKGRQNIITKNFRDELHKYISGIITGLGCFSLAVNGYQDHVHAAFELKPDLSISEILEKIKANSSKWINENRFVAGKFEWQRGYGAFSFSKSHRDVTVQYIINQEEHHKKKKFHEEYLDFLKTHEIDFDEKYLFEFYE